jgi:hypothetical protein
MGMAIHTQLDAFNSHPTGISPDSAALDSTRESTALPWVPESDGRDRTPAQSLPLTVRHVRLVDVPELRNLRPMFELDQPASQLKPFGVLRDGLMAAMPVVRSRRPAYVARVGDRLVGFGQFRPRDPDDRWIVVAIGTSVGVYESDPVIEALLEHGVRSAGLRGVKRLYAKAPREFPLLSAFRRQAWTSYATETIYSAAPARTTAPTSGALRPQAASDTWAIHQLYAATVPKPMQDAEALTSHHWDLGPTPRNRAGSASTSGWLLQDGHVLIGYARISLSARAAVVELLYKPERIEVLSDLINSALEVARTGPSRRVFCAVRGYQAELATSLEDRGFQPGIEQDLLIKYTTATIRLPIVDAVQFQLEVGEKIPQRVPSFLQGRSGDGAAS